MVGAAGQFRLRGANRVDRSGLRGDVRRRIQPGRDVQAAVGTTAHLDALADVEVEPVACQLESALLLILEGQRTRLRAGHAPGQYERRGLVLAGRARWSWRRRLCGHARSEGERSDDDGK